MLRTLTLTALVAYAAISTDLYLPGIPQMVSDLGASNAQGQLTLSAFLYGFALGQLGYGIFSDYHGRKPLLFVGLGIYAVATVVCIWAQSIETLIGARFIQGLGAASGPVVARAIVSDIYKGSEAARMMSSLAGAMALVPAVAPVIGSWILLAFDWRAMFGLLLIFCLATVLGVKFLVESRNIEGVGKLRLSRIFRQFPECFASPIFTGYTLCGSAIYAAMFTYISTTAFIIIGVFGVAEENFGYTFMAIVAGYILGARTSALLVSRWTMLRLMALGQTVAATAALLLISIVLFQWLSLPVLLLAFFLVFLSGGICLPLSQTGAIAAFPDAAGSASSVFGFIQILLAATAGFAVGVAYNDTLTPTVIGVVSCMALSLTGYWIVRRAEIPHLNAN